MRSLFRYGSIYILSCGMFFSCVHSEQRENEKIQNARRMRMLQNDLKKQQAAISNLKEQNWILKQKYLADNHAVPSKVPVPFQPSAGQSLPDESLATSKAILIAPKPEMTQAQAVTQASTSSVGPSISPAVQIQQAAQVLKSEEVMPAAIPTDSHESAEHNLYAKVIASYRQKRTSDLKKVTEILLKTYPQSVFADRAIFLNARLDFETANDQAALGECEKLIRYYPNANKLVSTYFLKAQILKKQGRIPEARSVLADVQTYFPGSPEYYRVPLELKLLSLQAKAAK